MPKLNKTELRKQLEQRSKKQLIDDIAELFGKFDVVQDYYEAKFNPIETAQLVEKYKIVIRKEFFPERGFGKARRSVARKAINDYKKVSRDPFGVAELMLYFVEMGVRFTNEYGDIDEPFYNSMESMYHKAIQHIFKHELQHHFDDRCREIMHSTGGIGWGFHDTMSEIYYEAFGV